MTLWLRNKVGPEGVLARYTYSEIFDLTIKRKKIYKMPNLKPHKHSKISLIFKHKRKTTDLVFFFVLYNKLYGFYKKNTTDFEIEKSNF